MKLLVDMHGRQIMVGDVLKMFHFIGPRRKKYYMYKWVIEKNGHLYGHHLGKRGDADAFYLSQDLLENTEIVQGFDDGLCFDDRPRIKRVKEFWCEYCGSGSDEHPPEHTQDCGRPRV